MYISELHNPVNQQLNCLTLSFSDQTVVERLRFLRYFVSCIAHFATSKMRYGLYRNRAGDGGKREGGGEGVFSIRYPLWKSFFGVCEGKGVGGKSNCQSQPSVLHHPGKEIPLPLPPQSHLALATSQLHETCHSGNITRHKNINKWMH